MGTPTKLDQGLCCIDLEFQGQPGVIAAYLLEDAGERALIETGPTSTLGTLVSTLEGMDIDPAGIDKLIVTHIHLDHAGAAGSFMQRFPHAHLYVHEKGVRHLVDPAKLLASASRIYGDRMDTLWGTVVPVPAERVTALVDGDRINIGRRHLDVLYTPGHASHHVALFDGERSSVFTGDVAAVRLQGHDYVRPPTPPPDIDLALWKASLARLRALPPRYLDLTHFGRFEDVDRHLHGAEARLLAWTAIVQQALASGLDSPQVVETLRHSGDAELRAEADDADLATRYELATPYGMTVDGLIRYIQKVLPNSA